jgi:cell division protein FtsB
MDNSLALQILNTVFKGLGTVGDLIKANKQTEAAVAVTDIQIKMGQVSAQFMELSQANTILAKENNDLKEKLEFKEKLKFQKPFYRTESGDGPYCPKCWDDERKGIRLDGPHTEYKRWDCPKCQNHFMENPDYQSPPLRMTSDWDPYER